MADTTIDIQDIITSFGSYYLDHGQNEASLRMRPFEQFGTQDAFTLVPTEGTILRMSSIEVEELLQPYQDTFTSKGGVEFAPVEIPLKQVKIDNEFNPNKLANSWLGFLASSKVNRSEWPFIRWFIDKYLLQRTDQDLELKAIYNGEYAAPAPGVAGAAIDAMDGVKLQINDGITAGDIVPIPTGALAIDPVDFCTQIEEFVAGIPELYWERGFDLNMSRILRRRYRKGREKKYNMNYAMKEELDLVDETQIRVRGRASMIGSSKIWGTFKENYVLGVKGWGNKNMFELEHVKRKVSVYTDWWIGIGYILPDQIFTNDQDL
jgi:hypothetical protein